MSKARACYRWVWRAQWFAVDVNRTAWARLGDAVRVRREALNLSQSEANAAGGPSTNTWYKVEHAIDPPYHRKSVAGICRVLGWTPDSFNRILNGDEPQLIAPPAPVAPPVVETELERRVRELQEHVARLEARLDAHHPEHVGNGDASRR